MVRHSRTFVHNHICYLFVNEEEYWKDARRECYKLGGEMLSIENEDVMKFITNKLSSKELGWNRKGVWLGLSKTGKHWRWTNGRKASFLKWADGEPSQILGRIGWEDCAQMRRDSNWLWHDQICGSAYYHYNYICEFQLSRPSDTEGQVSPSAASQEDDNGNTSVLIIIIGMGMVIIILMLVIAALLHFHYRRSKRRRAENEFPVRYSNNHNNLANQRNHSHQHSSSNNSSSGGSNGCQSTGSIPQTCVIPPGTPPVPPSTRNQQEEAGSLFLYSEINRPRGHSSNGILATTSSRGLGTSSRGFTSEQESLERVPLVSPSVSDESLLRAGPGIENTGTPGSGIVENQPSSINSPSLTSAGDYVDMNSLITRERQGEGEGQAKVKNEADVPDEDKHTYTNVDHRAEKVENLYEVLP
ncbi:hypothetical protein RRG08_014027 [Elysia crispata]|uniref:C-type lectin domain-containing protein n=1 Tax=Elysia crispata TaxID=231223 RepID=A0AAE0ZGU4_9GAST|nr:hypothetical protein RRG08_014027 [Elysia crispata]